MRPTLQAATTLAALAWLSSVAPAQVEYPLIASGGAVMTDGTILTVGDVAIGINIGPGTGVGLGAVPCWLANAAALRGDVNCDGLVNFFDIDPFLLALFDPPAYQAAFPGCDNADVSGDGLVNFFDIDPFLDCLFNGC